MKIKTIERASHSMNLLMNSGFTGAGIFLLSYANLLLGKLTEQGINLPAISQKSPEVAEVLRHYPHFVEFLSLTYGIAGLGLIALVNISSLLLHSSQNKNKSNA
jgi:hypothetical protein